MRLLIFSALDGSSVVRAQEWFWRNYSASVEERRQPNALLSVREECQEVSNWWVVFPMEKRRILRRPTGIHIHGYRTTARPWPCCDSLPGLGKPGAAEVRHFMGGGPHAKNLNRQYIHRVLRRLSMENCTDRIRILGVMPWASCRTRMLYKERLEFYQKSLMISIDTYTVSNSPQPYKKAHGMDRGEIQTAARTVHQAYISHYRNLVTHQLFPTATPSLYIPEFWLKGGWKGVYCCAQDGKNIPRAFYPVHWGGPVLASSMHSLTNNNSHKIIAFMVRASWWERNSERNDVRFLTAQRSEVIQMRQAALDSTVPYCWIVVPANSWSLPCVWFLKVKVFAVSRRHIETTKAFLDVASTHYWENQK